MKFKTATALSTAIASLFLSQAFALADSESGGLEGASYSSMTGSISNVGGGNQSGGVLTTGSGSETGGPRETPTDSQPGGALVSRGKTKAEDHRLLRSLVLVSLLNGSRSDGAILS